MERIMNKFLLLLLAAAAVTAAHAQLQERPLLSASINQVRPIAMQQEMQMATPEAPAVYYNRPPGAFSGVIFIEDGLYAGALYVPYLYLKPFTKYTYSGIAEGASGQETYIWGYQIWDKTNQQFVFNTYYGADLTLRHDWGWIEAPLLTVMDDGHEYNYRYAQNNNGTNDGTDVTPEESPSKILASPTIESIMQIEGIDLLMSSKTFLYNNPWMYYFDGANPYGDNSKGWWFGKNAGAENGMPINGIAQAFEKPTTAYLLKNVVLYVSHIEVSKPINLTCKIYRLADGIPAYQDEGCATLNDEPGELIAFGRATVTPETAGQNDFITFALLGEEYGLEFDIYLTVDDAILVVIDGYNDLEMDGLIDFSAMISNDFHTDEGFGELAYLKCGIPDENGNYSGQYQWMGLNNFFGREMKTGLTIFLTIDQPFLAFNNEAEDGEFIFPSGGSEMEIEFFSWLPSEDWEITCGEDVIPDWLNIELVDGMDNGDFNYLVNAVVSADPLPNDLNYRKAVVTFSTPGARINYTFKQYQGFIPPPIFHLDFNEDGEINIADLNSLFDAIINGADYNVSHVNILIDAILSGKTNTDSNHDSK